MQVPGFQVPTPSRSPLLLLPSQRVTPRIRPRLRPTVIDLTRHRPDARALDRIGIETALRHGILPLQPAGAVTPVAVSQPSDFRDALTDLQRALGPVACCLTDISEIRAQIVAMRAPTLASRATQRTLPIESCRNWSIQFVGILAMIFALLAAVLALLRPDILLGALTAWVGFTLIAVTGLRTIAAVAEMRQAGRLSRNWSSQRRLRQPTDQQPFISLLVPLFDEGDIANRLIKRLDRLEYPQDRLEALLILEADDFRTLEALEASELPDWMQIVRVPPGHVRTKPRAMNYALDFARGEVVGIYDAEDAPARDQLLKVADAFRNAGPETACVQGVLDFYNARQSWLTRCFAIDYATWFRLVLPGLVRLGFVIPLGGTTVFFRRDVLDRLGRWDAHNVTEDADLGIRMARRGYRVAFVASVTGEEATAKVAPWVRQRSRWIKGYAVTWAVHMRDPLRLWGELGTMRFLGFQILFLGTLSQFVLAPLLWTFWLIPFGLPHPLTSLLSWQVVACLGATFLISEIATLGTLAVGVATPRHRWLIKWVPLMHFYFPLAAIASWKGCAELISKPFFWDKTAHGSSIIRPRGDLSAPLPRHPDAAAPRRPG